MVLSHYLICALMRKLFDLVVACLGRHIDACIDRLLDLTHELEEMGLSRHRKRPRPGQIDLIFLQIATRTGRHYIDAVRQIDRFRNLMGDEDDRLLRLLPKIQATSYSSHHA